MNLANHKKCTKRLVGNALPAQVGRTDHGVSQMFTAYVEEQQSTAAQTTRTRRKSQEQGRVTDSTRKERTRLRLEAKVEELKSRIKKKPANENDPLLKRLTDYHNRLSAQVDNVLTEKVSAEVKKVVSDLSQIDDFRRTFQWSEADEQRLNHLNAEAKKMRTPEK